MSRWRFALVVGALVVAAAVRADDAPTTADWQAIKGVIRDQLAALREDDGARAFAFASLGLQAQFGDAENFMRMVHAGYQPLIDARYDEFLDGAVIDGRAIQPLRLTLPHDVVLVALYTMQKDGDGRWRIAGCLLAPSTVKPTTARPAGAPSHASAAPALRAARAANGAASFAAVA